jgi:ankyrin repeat protein
MIASQEGHTEALALLLANGANVNAAGQVIQNVFTVVYELDCIISQCSSVCCTHFA